MQGEKICCNCKEPKPRSDFAKNKRRKDGLQNVCRPCKQAWDKVNYQKVRESRKPYKRNTYDKQREYNWKANGINLTSARYREMYEEQEGKCQICKLKKKLCVDHDHKTGIVRGLICANCNRAIGLLGDDATTLQAAAEYLARFATKPQTVPSQEA